MCKRSVFGAAGLGLILVSLAMLQGLKPLYGQTSFGTILGSVTDPSEAVVPDALVTVTNVKTGISRAVKTDEQGNYRVGSLLPGVYSIKVEHQGFRLIQVASVELPVASSVTQNLRMELGAATQMVSVSARAALLDTSSAAIGTVVNNTSVVTLPLNGRSYTDLILMVPGSVPRNPSYATAGGHIYSVNGAHSENTSYTLDGINNNETMFKQFGLQPSIDALQEFRIQTNVTSAEYGQGAGANVSVALKSGTNELHGAGFEFVRNDLFDAIPWFRNYVSTPTNPATRAPYKRNQYGGVIGGPVYIPGLYNGRDKFFWLFNYEGTKIRQASSLLETIPTAAELAGNLQNQPPIFDPLSTTVNPVTGALTRSQINCGGTLNVICPSRINAATAAYAAIFFPSTSVPGSANLLNVNPLQQNTYQINNRADYKIKDNLNFFARYSRDIVNELDPTTLPVVGTNTEEKFTNAVASWTYVPDPTLVVDFKAGVNRTNVAQVNTDPSPGGPAYLAANPLQGLPIANSNYPQFPVMSINGFAIPAQSGTLEPTTDIQGVINVSKVKGRNTFKAGFNIDNIRNLSNNVNQNALDFDPNVTDNPQNSGATGSGLASFLLGYPDAGTRVLGNTAFYGRWGHYQGYVQDDLKLARRLTVNLGLRYEWDQWPREAHGRYSTFDRTTSQILWVSTNPVTGQPPNARNTIRDPDFNNFAPRIGFAFQASSNTTVRAGYSVFYSTDLLWEMQGERGGWPYAIAQNMTGVNTQVAGTNLAPLQSFFPAYTSIGPGVPPSAGSGLGRLDRTPYIQQWNLSVQRMLARDLLLEVDYVGTQGKKLSNSQFYNTALPGPGVIGSAQHPVPYPEIGTSVIFEADNDDASIYHGLQAKLQKNFSNGFQFLVSYAFARYIDNQGGGFTTTDRAPNPNDLAAERASGLFDIPQILTVSYVYQLPFGHGKQFLGNSGGLVNQILGGWEVSGITHYTSGAPYTVTINFDNANIGPPILGQRPNRVAYSAAVIDLSDVTQGWVNPLDFSVPAQYTFGNLGRDTQRGPGIGNWDLGLLKNFPLHGEKQSLQFRTEFFNAFNNVNFANPNATFCTPLPACNPNFGKITALQGQSASREIQFGLKFLF